MGDKWLDRTISVRAGVVEEIVLQSQCNSVLLMNFDTTNNLYVSLSRSVSNAEYMAVALPGSVAVLARPFEFDRIYLYSAADIPKIVLSEIRSINPMMLVSQMFSQTPVPQAVTVTGTVGLQPGNLNIEAVTKNLGVKVLDTVGLAPGDLNIDANKNLGVVTDGLKPSKIPTIINIPLTSSSVIYDYTFPVNTKKIFLAVREGDDTLKLSLDSSLSNYLSIPPGGSYYVEGINLLSPTKFYFQSTTSSKNLQIEYWV